MTLVWWCVRSSPELLLIRKPDVVVKAGVLVQSVVMVEKHFKNLGQMHRIFTILFLISMTPIACMLRLMADYTEHGMVKYHEIVANLPISQFYHVEC